MIVGRLFVAAAMAATALAAPADKLEKHEVRQACGALYSQCGGQTWTGATCCASGSYCGRPQRLFQSVRSRKCSWWRSRRRDDGGLEPADERSTVACRLEPEQRAVTGGLQSGSGRGVGGTGLKWCCESTTGSGEVWVAV